MALCKQTSKAAKAYLWNMRLVMGSYILVIVGTVYYARKYHPQGFALYALACLPMAPVLAMLATIARYLHDETDEYERDMTVRAMLWGIAATLAVSSFASFLRSFGWEHALPAFTEFLVFFVVMGLAKSISKMSNRLSGND